MMRNTLFQSKLTLDRGSTFKFDPTRPYQCVPESEFWRFDNPDYAYAHGPTGSVFLVYWNANRAQAGIPGLNEMSASLVKSGKDGVLAAPDTLYSLARSAILSHRALLKRRGADGMTPGGVAATNDNRRYGDRCSRIDV